MKQKSKLNKKTKFYKNVGKVLIIVSIIFLGIILYMDLLPSRYLRKIVFAVIIFDVINVLLLNLRRLKKKVKNIISTICIIVIILMSFGSFYLGKTLNVLLSNGDSKYKQENYSVVVLKDSNYNKLENIKNKKVGYYKNLTGADEATKYLTKKVKVNFEGYLSPDTLIDDLVAGRIDVILMEESIKQVLIDEKKDFDKITKVIHTYSIKVNTDSEAKEVNVTKEPFIIYLSGIDTYGKISSVSRSDVNIVMVVNPKTKQVLLISIPRDYYVQLHGTEGPRDKLTHAGIYGTDMSIKTIEDLLKININYYIKVNFTSVIDIVNALGGLEVYSEYTFISYSNYSFKKGYNAVNGKQALDFARTRKAFVDGDRQRGKNQQALIEAIIRKATNKSVLTKYSSLLDAIDGKYQTNMSMKKITSLIKMQLNDMASWNITSYSLSGTDSRNYTYTFNRSLYVMEPKEESINEAMDLIKSIIEGKTLEGSYGEKVEAVNSVSKVK